MANDGADFLVNASNYGWFVGTSVMEQCLDMARFRAVEAGRPVVVTSNNGPSGIVDARGRVVSLFVDERGRSTDVPGVHVAQVPSGTRGTPFLLWGEWAAWLLGGLGLAVGIRASRQPT